MFSRCIFLYLLLVGLAYAFPDDEFRLSLNQRIENGKVGNETFRLPEGVVPINYKIDLTPKFEDFTFNGSVEILARVAAGLEEITLHSLNLNHSKIMIDNDIITIANVTEDKERQFLKIKLPKSFTQATNVSIKIDFDGILNDNKAGFYKVIYERDGKNVSMAVTQFEATDARQAFPCFDEPHLKATFDITIHAPKDKNVVCNTPLKQSLSPDSYADDLLTFICTTTTKMSTYLVAFAVSDFDKKTQNENHEIYARPEYVADGRVDYALNNSKPTMDAIQEFVNNITNYENKKMTQIGIPDDWFWAGAMENWGLVTYRETLLYYLEGISTAQEKQRIASIIAHEYGHQWFGDLVSPQWWTYIWLNEGFATYFEYYAASVVEPSMRLMEQFVPVTLQYAMTYDVSSRARPMTTEAYTPEEISNLFDGIAYDKSGSVLRMVEHILTTAIFRRGLNSYLTHREFDVANETHLWENLDDKNASLPDTLENVMKTWTHYKGVPLVTATKFDNGSILFTQEPFGTTGNNLWMIPINWFTKDDTTLNNTEPMTWLTNKTILVDATITSESWFILNKHVTGYYRVQYDNATFEKITEMMMDSNEYKKVPPVNRAQLIDDSFNLAKVGKLDYDQLFKFLEYISHETDYIPLYSYYQGIEEFQIYAESLTILRKFIISSLEAVYKKLTTKELENDTHTDKLNRPKVLNIMCKMGHEDCLNNMVDMFKNVSVTPNLQAPVYCGIMRKDAKKYYKSLIELYKNPSTEYAEDNRIISSLGCANDESVITELLTNSNGDILDKHMASLLKATYTSSDIGLISALKFVTSKRTPYTIYTENEILSTIIDISKRAVTKEATDALKNVLNTLDEKTKKEVEGNMEANEKWLKTEGVQIEKYLESKFQAKPDSSSITEASLTAILFVTLVLTLMR